jgi:hypothetical protein
VVAYTEAQLTTYITQLESALARGEQSVSFSDRSATYRSVEEITQAIAYFEQKLRDLTGRSKQSLGVASKGFWPMTRWLFMLLAILLFIAQPVSADTLTSGNCAGGTSSSAGCAVVTVSGYGTVGIQITGTFTGTLSFEQTNDDTNWVAMTVYNVTAPSTGVTTATGPGLFTGSAAGIKRVRVRFSAYTSGSAIVSPIKTDARSAPPSTSGGSGAPTDATYITQTANGSLSAEQALGSLATGLMNSTTTTGVVSTLAPTDDNLVVGSGAAWQLKALTTCTGTGKAVTYDASTNAFGCNTISGGATISATDTQLLYRVSGSEAGGIAGSSWDGTTLTIQRVGDPDDESLFDVFDLTTFTLAPKPKPVPLTGREPKGPK